MSIKLGVLDFSNVADGATPRDAINETVLLARIVETYGHTRYWLAEHHSPGGAHSSPELLTAVVAGATRSIRVGPAGVLLHFASPFKVAEQFRFLETVYPRRIDLGLARGFADELTAAALLDGRDGRENFARYPEKVREVVDFLADRGPVHAAPWTPTTPEVWVLASGGASVSVAAHSGAAIGLSLFLKQSRAHPASVDEYRGEFRPGHLDEPKWNITVAGVCAETRERAEEIASRHRNPFVVPTVVGSPRECRDALESLCADFATDEVIFLDVGAGRIDERARCHELLASACA